MTESKKKSNHVNMERMIEGFDIDLTREKLERIDRLVDNYENIIVARLDDEYTSKTRRSDRLADIIASFGGSWRFITLFAVFLTAWILWNALPFTPHFDPHPFILLNLCLSFIAAFQAPVIMMSQNRQAARDKHESIIDFAINYKAEQEIDDIQEHLRVLEEKLGIIDQHIQGMAAKEEKCPQTGC